MLGDDLWLDRAGAVARDFDRQFTEVALEGLLAAPVAGVAGLIGYHLILAVAELVGQLGLQGPFNQGFGELLQDAILAN
ncbi:hypothetical protein SAMN05216344_1053 [Polaromonas sp. OV174]|nr:hypothetical protein SAMN05216344_1053 [Polaromonas sp. OV174]